MRLAPSPHVEIHDGQVVRPREIEAAIGETAFIPVITDRCRTAIETPTGPATLHYGANTISFELVEPGERQIRLAETGEPMVTVRAVEAE